MCCACLQDDLSSHPPASEHQQAAVARVADQDGFNWGYDPVHWGVPDGSYATDPDGTPRCDLHIIRAHACLCVVCSLQ